MSKQIRANNCPRRLTALADVADLRDEPYKPSLVQLNQAIIPTEDMLNVRDQGHLPTCTGFALAAVVDFQRGATMPDDAASAVMLYKMACLHDDFADNIQSGSTLRGALKGFFHNGVCKETFAPYEDFLEQETFAWELDVPSAKDAREVSLGAYFRLQHIVNDYHVALKETGAILVSARIHDGWKSPNPQGKIAYPKTKRGLHAFAIVGYTPDGFLVQNSWGTKWGGSKTLPGGVALWTYEDWFENVQDAWVLRLGISSPRAFDFKVARNFDHSTDPQLSARILTPRRQDIFGHYLNLDDGKFVKEGRFAQDDGCIQTMTQQLIAAANGERKGPKCQHLLIFAHGALTKRQDCAKRIRAWKGVFRRNGIYPIHIMWQTGFNGDVVDVLADILLKTKVRMGSNGRHLDKRLEAMARPLGRKLWRDLQVSAKGTFQPNSDGIRAIGEILAVAGLCPNMKVHFVGVSAGSYLLAEFADLMRSLNLTLQTATLLAPACSLNHYDAQVSGRVGNTIQSIRQFNLSPKREKSDSVDVYNKSLLHLVSSSLETENDRSLLGLQEDLEAKYPKFGHPSEQHQVIVAGRDLPSKTNAKSHQGFERDKATMNSLLEHVLGKKASQDSRFTTRNLSGY